MITQRRFDPFVVQPSNKGVIFEGERKKEKREIALLLREELFLNSFDFGSPLRETKISRHFKCHDRSAILFSRVIFLKRSLRKLLLIKLEDFRI